MPKIHEKQINIPTGKVRGYLSQMNLNKSRESIKKKAKYPVVLKQMD